MSNVVPFRKAVHRPMARLRKSPNRALWMEISEEVYEFFLTNPTKPIHVHKYGFLHPTMRRAFIRIPHTQAWYLCGMSNRLYNVGSFERLLQDENIDAVIRELGYEPSIIA